MSSYGVSCGHEKHVSEGSFSKKYYKDAEQPTEPKGAAGEPTLGTNSLLFLP